MSKVDIMGFPLQVFVGETLREAERKDGIGEVGRGIAAGESPDKYKFDGSSYTASTSDVIGSF